MEHFNLQNSKDLHIDTKKSLEQISERFQWNDFIIWNCTKAIQYAQYKLKRFQRKLNKIVLLNNKDLHIIPNNKFSSYSILWLEKLIYSKEKIVYLLNIPYMMSVLLADIRINITKKTIFLYQIIIILTLPILIYRLNKSTNALKKTQLLNYIFNDKKSESKQKNQIFEKIIEDNKSNAIYKKFDNIENTSIDENTIDSVKTKTTKWELLKEFYKTKLVLNQNLYINDEDIKKNEHDKYLLSNKNFILRQENSDWNRIIKFIVKNQNKKLLNIENDIRNKWIYKNIAYHLIKKSKLNYQVNINSSNKKNYYLAQQNKLKPSNNIKKILDKFYIVFFKDLQSNKLNLLKTLDTDKNLKSIEKVYHKEDKKKQSNRQDQYILHDNTQKRDINNDNNVLDTQTDEKKTLLNKIKWLNNINIHKQIGYIQKYINQFNNRKYNLINKIIFWVKEENFKTHQLSCLEIKEIYKKPNQYKNVILLGKERSKWHDIMIQWINKKTLLSDLQKRSSNTRDNKILKDAILKTLPYKIHTNNFHHSLENSDVKKIYINKLSKNTSCWENLLDKQEDEAIKNVSIIKEPIFFIKNKMGIQKESQLAIPEKRKIKRFLSNRNIINIIKELHYFPFEKSIRTLGNVKSKKDLDKILQTIFIYNQNNNNLYTKNLSYNKFLVSFSSEIYQTIKKNLWMYKVSSKQYDINMLKYLYSNMIHVENKYLFSAKENLFILKNINITNKYKSKKNKFYELLLNKEARITPIYNKNVINDFETNVYNITKVQNEYKFGQNFWFNSSVFNQIPIDIQSRIHHDTNSSLDLKNNINHNFQNQLKKHPNNLAILTTEANTSIKINRIKDIKILEKYNKWIATSEWWVLTSKIAGHKITKINEHIYDIRQLICHSEMIQNFISNYINTSKKINNEWALNFNYQISQEIEKSNKFLLKELYRSTKKYISLWYHNTCKTINSKESVIIGWFISLCIIYYNWFSFFTGIQYILMWFKFEQMRSLTYPSSDVFLNILVKSSIQSPSQKLRLTMYASRGWFIWLKSKILLYLIENTFLSQTLFYNNGIDLLHTEKNLVTNSLILSKSLFFTNKFCNSKKIIGQKTKNLSECIQYEKSNFLEKWSRRYSRDPALIALNNSFSKELEWLNDLFFHTEMSMYALNAPPNKFQITIGHKKPRILPEPITLTKRWLLVGAIETGKSYIIKNLAIETHFPLIHVSLKSIRNATPDFKYNTLKKYNKWIKQLADRGFLLWNILELAKMLSPCIFWISDLHEFHAKHNKPNKQGKIYDASLLMVLLLKMMGNDLLPENQSNITFIGSTDNPRLLDPKFVSRHRLDLIINLRRPSFHQRQTIFTNLLNNKNLYIANKRSLYELASYTMGYSVRDIATLANEVLLIKSKSQDSQLNSDVLKLAIYRQISKQSANNTILEREEIQYKIGKAIVQTILLYSKPFLPMTKRHDLWKTRFYYLSNIFLEFSFDQSTVTELVMFTNIVNCLSGSAARDAWILSKEKFYKAKLNISKQLKNDLCIASNILQSLLLEFPIRETTQLNGKIYSYENKYSLNIKQKNLCSLNFFKRFTSSIYWSYRVERLSLNWTLLFDSIQQSNKYLFVSYENKKQETLTGMKNQNVDQDLPYERRIIKRQDKRTQKVHNSFNEMLLENNLKSMGLPWISEYVMNYDALQLSILLLETRPLWNPPALTPSYSVLFFDRDLLINRNVLTKLYITYGEKFQIEKLNPKRIKKQILWSDLNTQHSNVHENSNNQESNIRFDIQDFIGFKQMAKSNAYLEQLQLQPPVYLYQSWTPVEDEQIIRSRDLLHHRESLQNDFLKYRELLIYSILLEVYHCLLKFFINNQELTHNIEDALLKNNSLNREYIETAVKNTEFW